jgi:hypothetical protein
MRAMQHHQPFWYVIRANGRVIGVYKQNREAAARAHKREVPGARMDISTTYPKTEDWKSNPLSTTQWMVGGVAVLGIAGLVYYFTTKSTTTGSGSTSSTPPAVVTLTTGAQSIIVPKTGVTIKLPPGGTWISGTSAGTSTPVFVPGTALSAGSATIPFSWNLNGTPVTTNLSITALA